MINLFLVNNLHRLQNYGEVGEIDKLNSCNLFEYVLKTVLHGT